MKKTHTTGRKLELHRETLCRLDTAAMKEVRGIGFTDPTWRCEMSVDCCEDTYDDCIPGPIIA